MHLQHQKNGTMSVQAYQSPNAWGFNHFRFLFFLKHPVSDALTISRARNKVLIQSPLNKSAPSSGNRTDASPSTQTFGASALIFPQEIASLRRAPDREPSNSGAVVMYTALSARHDIGSTK